MITRTHVGIRYVKRTHWGQSELDTATHAVNAFGFLLPQRETITWAAFANLIAAHSQDPKAQAVAAILKG
jgi:hypothetical protein